MTEGHHKVCWGIQSVKEVGAFEEVPHPLEEALYQLEKRLRPLDVGPHPLEVVCPVHKEAEHRKLDNTEGVGEQTHYLRPVKYAH